MAQATMKVNMTLVISNTNDPQLKQHLVAEEAKEVHRLINATLKKVAAANTTKDGAEVQREPIWLILTSPKRDGGKPIYIREDFVASIIVVRDVQMEIPVGIPNLEVVGSGAVPEPEFSEV